VRIRFASFVEVDGHIETTLTDKVVRFPSAVGSASSHFAKRIAQSPGRFVLAQVHFDRLPFALPSAVRDRNTEVSMPLFSLSRSVLSLATNRPH
jgi:hypothetical protein